MLISDFIHIWRVANKLLLREEIKYPLKIRDKYSHTGLVKTHQYIFII